MQCLHVPAFALTIVLALAACGEVAPTSDLPTGDPKIAYHITDKSVPPETAQKVLDLVVRTVPQLKTLRATQEASAGGTVWLNVALQSGPDSAGTNALERDCHFVYVNTNGPNGLITTATFVVAADLSSVRVFDDSGDEVVPVATWVAARGLK